MEVIQMSAKKLNKERKQTSEKDVLWEQGKEAMRLGRLYGLIDGTVCTSREQAITANHELTSNYSAKY